MNSEFEKTHCRTRLILYRINKQAAAPMKKRIIVTIRYKESETQISGEFAFPIAGVIGEPVTVSHNSNLPEATLNYLAADNFGGEELKKAIDRVSKIDGFTYEIEESGRYEADSPPEDIVY
jgi:hypothetical protein